MENNVVKAGPTKNFFINLITRDIELCDAIVELVDNSVDGAKRLEAADFSSFKVEINFNKNHFSIKDNCGGISIQMARETAFKFGRDFDYNLSSLSNSVGRFGIGMKRSLFKMGKNFIVNSISLNDRFTLPVNVDEWIKLNDWEFEFSSYKEAESNQVGETGTEIKVDNLNEDVKLKFADREFETALCHLIAKKLSVYIAQGLSISVNNTDIERYRFHLNYNKNKLVPSYYEEDIDGLKVSIIAGVVPKGEPQAAGWYIACNNRFILLNDQTAKTGWGVMGMPKFHNSFAAFRGFLFLESQDSSKLPWNTTKTEIDFNNQTYHHIKNKIIEMSKEVIDSIRKCEERKVKFNYQIQKSSEEKTLQDFLSAPLESNTKFKCSLFPADETIYKSVTFLKPQKELDELKNYMNVRSYKEVGIKSYEYFIEMNEIELED